MSEIRSQTRDAYEDFLVEIPMLLDDLWNLVRSSRDYAETEPGFSNKSLEQVEQFFLDAMSGREPVTVSSARLCRVFAAYVGEAVIERCGRGHWCLNDLSGDPAFGTPCVVDWAAESMRISPVERRQQLLENQQPFLVRLVEYAANKDEIEANFFNEFKKKKTKNQKKKKKAD